MIRPWLIVEEPATATTDPVSDVLLQYGAVGVIALVALLAVRVLFGRMATSLDRETQRADRLEEELRRLNETIRQEIAPALARSAEALADYGRASGPRHRS